mmetsp:Transcript_1649/g.4940  ORF Transcript_1649/g.4940 Transcript_1649/m.4940 type:complete len:291 (+) Transcript_1649:61-933(+)
MSGQDGVLLASPPSEVRVAESRGTACPALARSVLPKLVRLNQSCAPAATVLVPDLAVRLQRGEQVAKRLHVATHMVLQDALVAPALHVPVVGVLAGLPAGQVDLLRNRLQPQFREEAYDISEETLSRLLELSPDVAEGVHRQLHIKKASCVFHVDVAHVAHKVPRSAPRLQRSWRREVSRYAQVDIITEVEDGYAVGEDAELLRHRQIDYEPDRLHDYHPHQRAAPGAEQVPEGARADGVGLDLLEGVLGNAGLQPFLIPPAHCRQLEEPRKPDQPAPCGHATSNIAAEG